MTSERFNEVVEHMMDLCKDILCVKADEYATDDRLHNFKNAAGMMGCDPKEALAGMMAKHTISIFDMCRDGKSHCIGLWNEKITDHINYLLLLKAIVQEENDQNFVSNLPMGHYHSAETEVCGSDRNSTLPDNRKGDNY